MVDYTNTTVSGYNTSPPVDDGTESEANRTKWSTVKSKLADPLKTAIESIDTNLQTSFGSVPTLIGYQTVWFPGHVMGGSVGTATSGDVDLGYVTLSNSATNDFANAFLILPNKWNLGSILVRPYLVQTDTGTGDVVLNITAAAIGDNELISASGSSEASQTISMPGTQYDVVFGTEEEVAIGSTPASGDVIRISVERDYNDGSDTYSNDCGLVGIRVRYTSTAVTDD